MSGLGSGVSGGGSTNAIEGMGRETPEADSGYIAASFKDERPTSTSAGVSELGDVDIEKLDGGTVAAVTARRGLPIRLCLPTSQSTLYIRHRPHLGSSA